MTGAVTEKQRSHARVWRPHRLQEPTLAAPFAAVVTVFAAASAVGWLIGAIYNAVLVLRRIYPEVRERPGVLRHPVLALIHPQYLTPDGRRAHTRFLVFAVVSVATFAVDGLLLCHLP